MKVPIHPIIELHGVTNSVVLLDIIYHAPQLWNDKLKSSHDLILVRFSIYYQTILTLVESYKNPNITT